MNENFKSGFAAIIGRPNVGKSTLMNHLIGQKIAITSKKPQTTRNRIQTVYTCKEGQIVFLDTPGIHKAKNKLGEYMVQVAERTLKDVDVILWLVEPMKPIVFYVDSAFPEKWRGAIKAGIEDWNQAFEAAGFKNAIKAVDYPKNDPDFDPDDMRYSCFKYAASPTANAMGPSHVDPRTGEILTADVIWYHQIISLLHNWRFVQTAAVDKRVRKQVFDDEVMNEAIRYAAAHEIGHTLGLMHNMGASYSFEVDSLRNL